MRIIAGSAKGRRLLSPEGTSARPTSDRAREALFSSLESEYGDLRGIRFLDLFSGSGAVSAEAISRGARACVAVESDRAALAIARSNIEMAQSLSDVEEVTIVDSDVESFSSRFSNPYDVIFMDPPYAFPDQDLQLLLKQLMKSGAIVKESLIVIERASRTDTFPWPDEMRQVKVRKYGNAAIFYGEIGRVK
jgi:16S rRNA (guanine966-N2)-methyltransferase